ncbi:MAG: CotH kinase family protein, partial [Bacteroidota bacterium]|nr:CotH kinase family protein [Bacteroidota bacterium]
NMLMEAIVLRSDVNVAVQPSQPLPLFINADYHGLYRWMPPKDLQWLKDITGSDQVDVLEGPANEVLAGTDDHFRKGEKLLIDRAPADSIAKYFDLESLIDLACLDLFTGRADHDLNVRTFRPRTETGQWKWVLFDMDLWAPLNDNSLERMITATNVETPYIPQLIENPELQHMLLARIAALNAGALSPENTIAIVDSIYTDHRDQLELDHERWKDELDRPTPGQALIEIKHFLEGRGEILLEQLADRTGHSLRTVSIEVPDTSLARMTINGLPLQSGKQKLLLFSGIPMQLDLQLNYGVQLIGWQGHTGTESSITLDPARVRSLKPRFAR